MSIFKVVVKTYIIHKVSERPLATNNYYHNYYIRQLDVKEFMPSDVYEYVFLGSTRHKGIV